MKKGVAFWGCHGRAECAVETRVSAQVLPGLCLCPCLCPCLCLCLFLSVSVSVSHRKARHGRQELWRSAAPRRRPQHAALAGGSRAAAGAGVGSLGVEMAAAAWGRPLDVRPRRAVDLSHLGGAYTCTRTCTCTYMTCTTCTCACACACMCMCMCMCMHMHMCMHMSM